VNGQPFAHLCSSGMWLGSDTSLLRIDAWL
jgi:hypothetical protein